MTVRQGLRPFCDLSGSSLLIKPGILYRQLQEVHTLELGHLWWHQEITKLSENIWMP